MSAREDDLSDSQWPLSISGEGRASNAHITGGEVARRIVRGPEYVSLEARAAACLARRAPTPAEDKAWSLLRNRRCLGLKFRRQQVIGVFRADFFCAELRLVIEIDGAVHDDPSQATHDTLRTQAFETEGIRILRLRNEDVSHAALASMLKPYLRSP